MTRPTILLTGAAGQLGFELTRALPSRGELAAFDRTTLDLADRDALVRTVREVRPQIIVNAAGYTAVDRAESEPHLAHAINADAPAVLADEARRIGAVLIHYSTDYVFDGTANTPYGETAPPNPLSVYGRSKLAGERAIEATGAAALIFRTSWVYSLRGQNFMQTMLRLAAERDEIRVVADQFGVPNWSRTLAEATATLIARGAADLSDRAGLYHMSCVGQASWWEFARAIIGDVDRPQVKPITTAEYPTAAQRPAFAVLATEKFQRTFGFSLAHWRDALAACKVTA